MKSRMQIVTLAVATLALAALFITNADAGNTWTDPTSGGHVVNLNTTTTPDETAPTLIGEGFNLEPNKPYMVHVRAKLPRWYGTGDVGHDSYRGDTGCIHATFDGGCVYPGADAAPITAEATTFTAGMLQAYRFDPATRTWVRSSTYDLGPLTAGVTDQVFSVPVTSQPVPVGRIAYVPYGASVPVEIYITR
jgi:hypothetical protein